MTVVAAESETSSEIRERLSEPSVRAFVRLAAKWRFSEREQLSILGESVGRTTLYDWARGVVRGTLNQDQIMRISYLLGIYEGLHRIWRHSSLDADAWIRREIADHPFNGRQPLAFMLAGGIPAFSDTRAYIDGATGGPPSRAGY